LDVAELAALVDDARLLHHRGVEPFAEGEAIDQQRRRDRGLRRRCRVFLGVAAQRRQALLLFAQRAVAFGDLACHRILALLHDLEQGIEPLRAHLDQGSWVGMEWAAGPSASSAASASRLDCTSAASATSWPRKAWIAGQRATASSTIGSLPRW